MIPQIELCWKPYRTHRAPAFSPAHIETRLSACNFFLQFQDEWFERVIWTDEKMFVLIQEPHRQNDRTWAPVSPEKVAQCKKAGGEKCMAWTGIFDGRCLPVVWFQGSLMVKCTWTCFRIPCGHLLEHWLQRSSIGTCKMVPHVMSFLLAWTSSNLNLEAASCLVTWSIPGQQTTQTWHPWIFFSGTRQAIILGKLSLEASVRWSAR